MADKLGADPKQIVLDKMENPNEVRKLIEEKIEKIINQGW